MKLPKDGKVRAVDAAEVVAWLKKNGNKSVRDGMARYAIPSDNAFGIPVGKLRAYARSIGRSHRLAEELWKTDLYEARMLATMVDNPDEVTPGQMDRWARDFDNWAICDTACFHLFDRTPFAFDKVRKWANHRDEFVKRGAFALLASLAGHDRKSADDQFRACLPLIERAATDERNFVKKGVSWALRGMGSRSASLHKAAIQLATKLAAAHEPSARWIGKDALRDLNRPLVKRRVAAKDKKQHL